MAILEKFLKSKTAKPKSSEADREKQDNTTVLKGFMPGVLLSPRISEKSNAQLKEGKYVFIVSNNKNKIEIENAVEKIYGVKVKSVKILNMPGKKQRLGRIIGYAPGFKKAVVTLEKGQSIEVQ